MLTKIINDRKYHYVYKITHIPTKRYYIGIHSTDDLNDGYMGSGTIIKSLYKKHQFNEFVKEYIYFGRSRQDILDKESEIVTEKVIITDPLILNIDIGGRSSNEHINLDKIPVKDKYGNKLTVSKSDPRYLSGELVHINSGNTNSKGYKFIRKDNNFLYIHKSELQKYLDEGWELGNKLKGRKSPTKNRTHIKRGGKEIMVYKSELQKYLDEGWEIGRLVAPTTNKIMITKNGSDKYCDESELQKYLDEGWVRGGATRNRGRRMLVNKETGEYISVYYNDPRVNDENWCSVTTYNGSPAKGTKYMNKDGIVKRVKLNMVDEYISNGWSLGKKIG